MKLVYKNDRPELSVELLHSKTTGECCQSTFYKLTTRRYRLSRTTIDALRQAGILGGGQEFYVHSTCDGTELPSGNDQVWLCQQNDNGVYEKLENESAGYIFEPYYVYVVEDRCDSSD